MKHCHQCRQEWRGITQPGTRERCARCGADLHACLNCRFHDRHRPNECMIETDPVRDRAAANFCEEFQIADREPAPPASPAAPPTAAETDRARERWKKLFNK